MSDFHYSNGELYTEGVALSAVAGEFSTPAYVYSRAAIEREWRAYADALGARSHLICYAVKANSNLAVLSLLAKLGSGFDIVSAGELERVLKAGGDAAKVVFSGVGKTSDEMQRALEAGIKCFNVESESELQTLNKVAASMQLQAPVSLRINPDVDAETHPYISTGLKENKFGIAFGEAGRAYALATSLEHINVVGVDCHIGSQITTTGPYIDALEKLLGLLRELKGEGISLSHIDIGGGLGIQYQDETPPSAGELIESIYAVDGVSDYELLLEPGRSIVGNAGVLLTRVLYLKENTGRHFAIVDAAMNDMLRPALYEAWLDILPLRESSEAEEKIYDIVGPVCETGDFIALDRAMRLKEGDPLAVMSSGAYGFSMSSNYNTRARSVEIMVDGNAAIEIRRRESIEELMQGEKTL